MQKLCLFGDSIGKGIVYNAEKRKYETLDRCFANIVKDNGYELVNRSHFGSTLCKGKELVKRHMNELSDYDFVLLEYGGNDSDFNWHEVAKTPFAKHDCMTPMNAFENDYKEMISEIKAAGGNPVLMSLAPVDAQRYFRTITRKDSPRAVIAFLIDTGRIARWNEMYDLAVRRIGVDCNVPVVDIRTPFLLRRSFREYICEDGIHPNAAGHQLIARELLNYLDKANGTNDNSTAFDDVTR